LPYLPLFRRKYGIEKIINWCSGGIKQNWISGAKTSITGEKFLFRLRAKLRLTT
jgi:hypothetical protein